MALLSRYPGILPEKKRRPLEIDLDMKGSIIYHTECLPSPLKAITYSMILKGLSQATCKIYLEGFKRFLSHHADSDINTLRYRELLRYLKAQAVIMHPTKLKQTIQYFQNLVAECNRQYHQTTYLFENKRQAHNTSTLKNKLFRILGHYMLEDIYRKQYQQILKQTDFSQRTRAIYLNAFMKFLKHFNYKHPAFISEEDIRAYRALHRKTSAAHQNTMISSFKFFFYKVHKRHVSRQTLVRPCKALHLPAYSSQSQHAAMQGSATNSGLRNHQNHQSLKSIHTKRDSANLKRDDRFIMASPLRPRVALSSYTAKRNHSPP